MSSRRHRPPRKRTANPSGLWRDRGLLVVDLREHQFPARCLKSNRPCELPVEFVTLWTQTIAPLELDRLEDDDELLESGRVHITRDSKSGVVVEIRLRLPLSPGWRQIVVWPWGMRLAAVGGIGVLLSFLALWLWPKFHWVWLTPAVWGQILVVSLAVLFGGLSIRSCLAWILPIRRIEEQKVWLGGVHREWLRTLPPFVPSSGMLIRELEVANWKFWPALAIGFLLNGLCFVTIFSMQPDALGRVVVGAYLVGIAIAILNANASSRQIQHTRQRLDQLYLRRLRRRGRKRP